VDIIKHPNMSKNDLHTENKKCWGSFYSLGESFKRSRCGSAKGWSWPARMTYLLVCLLFKRAYAGYGMAADSVRRKKSGTVTKLMIKAAVSAYNHFHREKHMRLRMRVLPTPLAATDDALEGLRLPEESGVLRD
jgi:hypothetical protein